VNPTYTKIVGVRSANGSCEWHGQPMMLPRDQNAIRLEIDSYDPSNCNAILKEGIPKQVKPIHQTGMNSSRSSSVAYTGKPAGIDPETSGYFHSWIEDPVGWDVNSVTDYIDYWWDGNNIVGNFYGSDWREWNTNWYELTSCCYSFNIWWDGWGGNANVSTIDLFNTNWPFGFNWAWYNPNRVYGTPQGDVWFYPGLTWGGDNSGMLHSADEIVKTCCSNLYHIGG